MINDMLLKDKLGHRPDRLIMNDSNIRDRIIASCLFNACTMHISKPKAQTLPSVYDGGSTVVGCNETNVEDEMDSHFTQVLSLLELLMLLGGNLRMVLLRGYYT